MTLDRSGRRSGRQNLSQTTDPKRGVLGKSEKLSLATAWNRNEEWLLVADSARPARSSSDKVRSWTISKHTLVNGLARRQERTKVAAHGAYRPSSATAMTIGACTR